MKSLIYSKSFIPSTNTYKLYRLIETYWQFLDFEFNTVVTLTKLHRSNISAREIEGERGDIIALDLHVFQVCSLLLLTATVTKTNITKYTKLMNIKAPSLHFSSKAFCFTC